MNNDILQRAIAIRDELTAAIERARTKDEWPKVGDEYYAATCQGVVASRYENDMYDALRLARGSVYRTREEAERADQRRIVEAELRRMAREAGPLHEGGWYEIVYGEGAWRARATAFSRGIPRFPTNESAEAAIDAITQARLDLLLDEGK